MKVDSLKIRCDMRMLPPARQPRRGTRWTVPQGHSPGRQRWQMPCRNSPLQCATSDARLSSLRGHDQWDVSRERGFARMRRIDADCSERHRRRALRIGAQKISCKQSTGHQEQWSRGNVQQTARSPLTRPTGTFSSQRCRSQIREQMVGRRDDSFDHHRVGPVSRDIQDESAHGCRIQVATQE